MTTEKNWSENKNNTSSEVGGGGGGGVGNCIVSPGIRYMYVHKTDIRNHYVILKHSRGNIQE